MRNDKVDACMWVHSRLLAPDIISTIPLDYPQRLSFRRNPYTESFS